MAKKNKSVLEEGLPKVDPSILKLPEQPTPQQPTPSPPQALPMPNSQQGIDIKTGKLVDVPGRFLGASSPNPTEQLARAEIARQQQAQQAAQLASQIGAEPVNMATLKPTPLDTGQVAAAGIAGAIPKIITGIGTGAAAGAAAGAIPAAATAGLSIPTGAIIGGVVGLVGGVYSAVKSSISNQQSGQISAQTRILKDGKTNLRRLVSLAKADPLNQERYVSEFNTQLSLMQQSYGQLYLDTQQNLHKFTGKDGTAELQDFANFYAPGGGEDIYKAQMALALQGGDINSALMELQAIEAENE